MALAMTTEQPMIYVPALRERGFVATLTADGTRFTVEPREMIDEAMHGKIVRYRDSILAELQAERMVNGGSDNTSDAHSVYRPSTIYNDPRHDMDAAEAAWSLLYRLMINAGYSASQVWTQSPGEQQPSTRPFCTVRSELVDAINGVGGRFLYLPILYAEDGECYVWG